MKYLCQLDYEHIAYPTDLDTPNSLFHNETVKRAGCGPCCICMMVHKLTGRELSIEACIDIAVACKANRSVGTDMERLAPEIARQFGLTLQMTDEVEQMVHALEQGSCVIANTGGNRGTYQGVFSHEGHYVTVVGLENGKLCILDPSLRKGKYDKAIACGKVERKGYLLYCAPAILDCDADNRSPRYFLFSRKASTQNTV